MGLSLIDMRFFFQVITACRSLLPLITNVDYDDTPVIAVLKQSVACNRGPQEHWWLVAWAADYKRLGTSALSKHGEFLSAVLKVCKTWLFKEQKQFSLLMM